MNSWELLQLQLNNARLAYQSREQIPAQALTASPFKDQSDQRGLTTNHQTLYIRLEKI